MCYTNTRCRVKIRGELTPPFDIQGGLKQGCPLSTLLFNLTLEWIMRHTRPTRTPMVIGNATIDRLAYADDVDLCGEDIEEVAETYQEFRDSARRTGLQINATKTKVMKVTRGQEMVDELQLGEQRIEAVQSFKYLGSTVTSNNLVEEEIGIRIGAGSRCSWALNDTLRSRMLSRATKTQIYTAIIRPVVLYGCETWRLTKESERRLEVFERSILRRIWGPVWDNERREWRRRHNEELVRVSQLPTISNVVRSHRLRWAGHVARMEDGCLARDLMLGTPRGRRPLGRPRKRWVDNIKEDVRQLGVEPEEWIETARNRPRWRKLVKAAKEQTGPQPPE